MYGAQLGNSSNIVNLKLDGMALMKTTKGNIQKADRTTCKNENSKFCFDLTMCSIPIEPVR
jgi:hypothetical protein